MVEPIVTKLKCKFEDCLHEWYPRADALPKVCPKCKRYGWNKSKLEVEQHVTEESSHST